MECAAIEDDRKHKFLMTARFEWAFHLRTFHIRTDECGDTNIGDQLDVTL